jgi:hypothetical protein
VVDQPVTRHRPGERGYVLLGVLLVSVLVTSMVLGFSRHTVMVVDSAQATVAAFATEDAAQSGLAWARQTLLADGSSSATLDMGDGRQVSVSLVDAGADRRSIVVEAAGRGVRQTFGATAEIYATAGASTPELTDDARTTVAGSAQLIEITGTASYVGAQLTGILLIRDGASLTLDDVVLDGSVVSEMALFGVAASGSLHLRNGVQVTPGAVLPGVALAVPGVDVDGDGSERVQLEGVVVAGSLTLPGRGALHAQVAAADTPTLAVGYDLVGYGRAPQPWPPAVDTHSADVRRLAFPVPDPTTTEESAIRAFSFPSSGGQAAPLEPMGEGMLQAPAGPQDEDDDEGDDGGEPVRGQGS